MVRILFVNSGTVPLPLPQLRTISDPIETQNDNCTVIPVTKALCMASSSATYHSL